MAGGSARQTAVERALSATRDTARVVLRPTFDPDDPADWDAFVADVAALANSGGGAVVVGGDNGVLDAGAVAAELSRRTDDDRPGLVTVTPSAPEPAEHDGATRTVVLVAAATVSPLLLDGRVLVRHGARTEPARAADLERFVAREVRRARREWLGEMAKVTRAPAGSQVVVVPPGVSPPVQVEVAEEFRVVDDPKAPALGRTDFDRTHPYREVDVVRLVSTELGAGAVRHYDVQCVRRVYDVDRQEKWFHRPKFGSPQYSQAFVDWLVSSARNDGGFFTDAVARDQARHRT